MSNFELKFTLKQHTPMIHFQSDQKGATLRATELKPKLDRFLVKYAFNDDFEKYKTFLIGYESLKKQKKRELIKKDFEGKLAFDYRVNIENIGQIKKSLPNNFLYFANNPLEEHEKKCMVTSSNIHLTIFTFKSSLCSTIKKYFDDFLLITNFGARSTKGYGSFTHNQENVEQRLKKYRDIVFRLSTTVNEQNWEQNVDSTHKKLKAGLNPKANKGQHYKSLLFRYMCEKEGNLRWEKRKIKQKFPNVMGANDKKPIDCSVIDDKKFRYVRAMLGVAEINEYDKGKKTVKISSDEVARFASPIVYKVIGNSIYLLGDDSYRQIMDKKFKFSFGRDDFSIQTPSETEFNLHDFLRYVEKNETLINEVKI